MPSLIKPRSKPIKKYSIASKTQQGTDTAKRMRAKLATFKKQKQTQARSSPSKRMADEDILPGEDHEDAYSVGSEQDGLIRKEDGAITRDLIDARFNQLAETQKKTPDEQRLEMTKKLIEDVQKTVKQDNQNEFIANMMSKVTPELDIYMEGDDPVRQQLKYKILEQKDKLFYNIADEYKSDTLEYDRVFLKGHKKSITGLEWMPDNKRLITASKDCQLILWDIQSGKKDFFKGEKFNRDVAGHFDEVSAVAISPSGKYMVSGGKDRIVRIWDIHNQKQIQQFMGHRDTITSIKFDKDNDQFYTVSNDRSLKVWNIREMMYMDSHYGHVSDILDMDKYSRDRVISCGLDRQVIFWKINEDSEMLYKNPDRSTDTINVINNHFFVTGSHTDNSIDLWLMNKKRPIFNLPNCHRGKSWLNSVALIHNSDLLVSGGFDGCVNFYKMVKERKVIQKINTIEGLPGSLNCIKFSNTTGMQTLNKNEHLLAVSHSEDQRMGRWHVEPKVKMGVTILRKTN